MSFDYVSAHVCVSPSAFSALSTSKTEIFLPFRISDSGLLRSGNWVALQEEGNDGRILQLMPCKILGSRRVDFDGPDAEADMEDGWNYFSRLCDSDTQAAYPTINKLIENMDLMEHNGFTLYRLKIDPRPYNRGRNNRSELA